MAIVQIVHVSLMPDSDMPAAWAVLVVMFFMVGLIACGHGHTPRGVEGSRNSFSGMVHHVVKQTSNMLICQRVKNMFAVATSYH